MIDLKKRLLLRVLSRIPVPLALLGVCLLSYGVLAPWLGFYWDDLAFLWIAEKLGSAGLERYFASARPIWGAFIRADLYLLGNTPWLWQLFAIFWRWMCALALWGFLRLFQPKEPRIALWAALFFAVYPGFDQQFIPINYSHFFLVYATLLFSFAAMLAAVRGRVDFRRWLWLGLVFSAVNLLCMEYFYLLELLRPLLLWFALEEGFPRWRERLRQTLRLWMPYLVVFLGISIWRAFFFQNQTLAHQPLLLQELRINPSLALWQLARTVLYDWWLTVLAAWGEPFHLPDFAALGRFSTLLYLALMLVAIAATGAYLWHMERQVSEPAPRRQVRQAAALGALALLLAGWPMWLTQLGVSLEHPASRFTLPFTLGAVLLLAAAFAALPERLHWVRISLLALLIGASVGYQFLTATQYRRAFNAQKQFFWQLVWRVPELKDGTAVLVNDLPMPYVTDNSLSAMLNWIYAPENSSERMAHMMYFPSLRQHTILKELQPGKPIEHNYWAATFYGNTSQTLAIHFQPPGCLRVLDPEVDVENPTISILMRRSALLSSWKWILPKTDGPAPRPPEEIYGTEPAHGWCYYYQRAELARQQGDWTRIVELGERAFAMNDYPNDPVERFPFIEAYAHLGNWQRALELSRVSAQVTPLIHPAMCRLWQRIERDTPVSTEKENALAQAFQELQCARKAATNLP